MKLLSRLEVLVLLASLFLPLKLSNIGVFMLFFHQVLSLLHLHPYYFTTKFLIRSVVTIFLGRLWPSLPANE